MSLPFIVSLPHAGLDTPEEVRGLSQLTPEDIISDGDEEAAGIYGWLEHEAEAFRTTNVARAFVDLNRAEGDIRKDGVVKTHTIWDQPIYREPLTGDIVSQLIDRYWRPYHSDLSGFASPGKAILGLDCHTMAAVGPPVGPDTGAERPAVCLGNRGGTCPEEWLVLMKECFEKSFGREVRINDPFGGGYIVRTHSSEMPWVQIEISRGDFMSTEQKRNALKDALASWVRRQA